MGEHLGAPHNGAHPIFNSEMPDRVAEEGHPTLIGIEQRE